MRMTLLAGALIMGSSLPAWAQNTRDSLPDASSVPEGTIQLSGVVPAMGEHWGKAADMPVGPIYCVHQGRIVCLEFMLSQEDFAAGKSWPVLTGMEGLPPVIHTSIAFEPEGHEGYEIPHYDIHMYFLSPEEIAQIQPE